MANPPPTVAPGSALVSAGQPKPFQPGEFVLAGPSNIVTFGLVKVAPPSPLYIQRDDQLAFLFQSSFANDQLLVSGRFLRAADGQVVPFTAAFKVSGAGNRNVQTLALGEGYLLSLSAVSFSSSVRGQLFCTAFIQRGLVATAPLTGANQILFSDYVMSDQPVGWPGGRIVGAVEGTGGFISGTQANPAAGADISVPVTPNVTLRMHWISATLTTSATVATRIPTFFIGGSGQGVPNVAPITGQAASTAVVYKLIQTVQPYTDAGTNVTLPLPPNLVLPTASSVFVTSTAGIQAGDQWSNIHFIYEQFLVIA